LNNIYFRIKLLTHSRLCQTLYTEHLTLEPIY